MTGSELIVVFGGRSEIGIELAARLAQRARIILAARGTGGLDETVQTLKAQGAAAVHTTQFDADDLPTHEHLLKEIASSHGPIGTAALSGQLVNAAISAAPGDPPTQFQNVLINLANFCALISVSLGMVNLLPIPILDGGHLLFYAWEGVVRRPLSAGIQAAGYRVGLALVVCLMLFANVNDLHLQKVFHFFGALFS